MRALMMTQYGDVTTSLEFQSREVPTPGPTEVLIEVRAASVNPIDYKVLRGDFKVLQKLQFPAPIGRDVSGTITAVGSEVRRFKIGDEVFSRVSEDHVGTLAEYVTADEAHIAHKPDNLSHEEAASLPLVSLTSYQALVDIANLKPGDKILIHAGSGGIGSQAIQLAKLKGAFVATTTSTKNVAMVRGLGADVVIDYKRQDYRKELSGYDVVYDTLGGDYTRDAFEIINEGGRVVSIVGAVDDQTAKQMGLNLLLRGLLALKARPITKAAKHKSALYRLLRMTANGDQLTELAELYGRNEMRPVVGQTFPFERTKEAFELLTTGRARGKLVISMA